MRHISAVDTAKLVRKALKAEFPSQKFSVRSTAYSGGASISIYWTDGPSARAVKRITSPFEGAHFDGMIDLKSAVYGELNGERVHFGADYIFPRRTAVDILDCHCGWTGTESELMLVTGPPRPPSWQEELPIALSATEK